MDFQTGMRAGVIEIRSGFAASAVAGIVKTYLKKLRVEYIVVMAFIGAAGLAAVANECEKLSSEK